MTNRDDFTPKTKELLAKRVGYRCSNPKCKKLTCGANQNPEQYSNIGVAAHICAAAPGGKRYDAHMTSDQRKHLENGIWLCQSCSKLIDSDESRYTVTLLKEWKKQAETGSISELETLVYGGITSAKEPMDSDLVFVKQMPDPDYALCADGKSRRWYDEGYSMIDIQIQNRGKLDAAITRMKLTIEDYHQKSEPHFEFTMKVVDGKLMVYVLNNGWGIAYNTSFMLRLMDDNDGAPVDISYIKDPQSFSTTIDEINVNEQKVLFEISADCFSCTMIKYSAVKKYKKMRMTPYNYELVQNKAIQISADISFWQENKKEDATRGKVSIDYSKFGFDPSIQLTSKGFLLHESPVCYSLGRPDTIYATVIDKDTTEKEYTISRIVESGKVDHFNIYVGSDKSCTFRVILTFMYNVGMTLSTEPIMIDIERYTNSTTCNRYVDGCQIDINNVKRRNEIDVFSDFRW